MFNKRKIKKFLRNMKVGYKLSCFLIALFYVFTFYLVLLGALQFAKMYLIN